MEVGLATEPREGYDSECPEPPQATLGGSDTPFILLT